MCRMSVSLNSASSASSGVGSLLHRPLTISLNNSIQQVSSFLKFSSFIYQACVPYKRQDRSAFSFFLNSLFTHVASSCAKLLEKRICWNLRSFNSNRIGLEHQYGRRFIVFGLWTWRVWRHVKTLYWLWQGCLGKREHAARMNSRDNQQFLKQNRTSNDVLIYCSHHNFFQSLTAGATYISSFSFSTKCWRGQKQKSTAGKQRAVTWPACATQEKANSLKRTCACSGIILVSPNCG